MMVASCSICGEQYGVTEDVTFHKFPANEERRKQWLDAIQGGTWLPGKRSMLCSNHFAQDKFVHKIFGDKIRRYLMPDTIPTIFDRTKGKLKNGASPQINASNESLSSNSNTLSNAAATTMNIVPCKAVDNSNDSLNLEILATTSVGLEPYKSPAQLQSIQMDNSISDVTVKPVEIPVTTQIAVTGSSTKHLNVKAANPRNQVVNSPGLNKKTRRTIHIQTDLTMLPRGNCRVNAGDFKQLRYRDVRNVSECWTNLNNSVKKMKSSMKVLRQRNRRLEKRVTDLKEVVKFLKNRIVARDSVAVRSSTLLPQGGNVNLVRTQKAVSKITPLHRVSNPLKDHDYTSFNK